MRTFILSILCMVSTSWLTGCGGSNYFTSMADKNSNAAVYEDVLKLVDAANWDEALARMGALVDGYRDRPEVIETEAGIYAGQCGLNFLTFVGDFGGTGSPFSTFFSGFASLTPDTAKCQQSQTLIETKFGESSLDRLASAGERANNLNTFMAVLGTAKIGSQLKAVADNSPSDGNVDAGFDACLVGSISHEEVAQVGTGFALMLLNFSTIAASFDPSVAANIDQLIQDCAVVNPSPCTATDPDDTVWADPVARGVMRSLIASQEFGIGTCNNANPLTCCPPVP